MQIRWTKPGPSIDVADFEGAKSAIFAKYPGAVFRNHPDGYVLVWANNDDANPDGIEDTGANALAKIVNSPLPNDEPLVIDELQPATSLADTMPHERKFRIGGRTHDGLNQVLDMTFDSPQEATDYIIEAFEADHKDQFAYLTVIDDEGRNKSDEFILDADGRLTSRPAPTQEVPDRRTDRFPHSDHEEETQHDRVTSKMPSAGE